MKKCIGCPFENGCTAELARLCDNYEPVAEKRIARIFEDSTGKYFICGDDLEYLDARGASYATKAAAQRAAKEAGYTHCIGSGAYTRKVQKLS
jgi:hypothetical protein